MEQTLTLETLSQWIDTQKHDIEAVLKTLVEINTFTANTDGVDAGMAVLDHVAAELGLTVEPIYKRHRLIKAGNGTGKRILLIAHMDTVHPPEGAFQHYEPLADGFVKGPGIGDIKGGLVIGLWTLKAVSQLLTDFDLQLIVSADEETGSPTLKDWYADRNAHGADLAIGLEPGFPQGALSATVDLGVVYQRRGYASVHFSIVGQAAHSGTPELGISAIDALAQRIVKLHALNDTARNISVNVGLIHGGTAPNTVAHEAEATVSFRYNTLADGIATREQVEQIILEPLLFSAKLNKAESAVYTVENFLAPMERTPESQVMVDVVMKHSARLGHHTLPIARGGGSDANHTSGAGTPSICGMGAPSEGIHTDDEKIYLPGLFERIELLSASVVDLLQ
ncbi:MAG: M20/M25/M40 family metallo-hydrolase [Phototrophicaceae bacterium]|jgi:glutamate carboxypeptidase